MKKLIVVLAVLIILITIGLYVFIPSRITIHRSLKAKINREGLVRRLSNSSTWAEWWPGKSSAPGRFDLDGIIYFAAPPKNLSIPIDMETANWNGHTELTLIAVDTGSTILDLETSVNVPVNPFRRIPVYSNSKKLESGFDDILKAIGHTYATIPALYDFDIRKEKVVDSILVSTSGEVKGKPTIAQVYALIDELKAYIKKNDATETGYPMQNIYTSDSVNYLIRVAIPVNKRLPDSGKFRYKWMLGGGNILITEVKGGQSRIDQAYAQIHNYVADFQRIAPAISFESLVTDRRVEPDTAKWITRIYYPVM
jgi:hypothetical protein